EETEIRLYRAHAAICCESASRCLKGTAVGNAEQADGRPDQRKILRFDAPQAMAPRQRIGLLVGQRAVDLGDDLVGNGRPEKPRLNGIAARAATLGLGLAPAGPAIAV